MTKKIHQSNFSPKQIGDSNNKGLTTRATDEPQGSQARNEGSTSSFDNILLQEKNKMILSRTSTLAPQVTEKILEAIKTKYNFPTIEYSKAILTVLFHQGATARSCDGNLSFIMFEKEIKLADIRKILKEQGAPKGERKLAKTLATEIHGIAKKLELPGNLYNLITRENPGKVFTMDEQCWLSDFQANNVQAPASLREMINNAFNRSRQPSEQKKRKTGK